MPSSQSLSSQHCNPSPFTSSECARDEGMDQCQNSLAITLQANCKYNTFNVDADLAYMLTQNRYLQDTQKAMEESSTQKNE
uniref:Uncharacterized protein n=1 Tax=Romanomermis culicivorax TaxID=13658 RepID=A0A915IJK8_ROMCU